MTALKILLFCATVFHIPIALAIPRFNLFNPYDIVIRPPVWPETNLQITVGFEKSLKTRSFQADDNEEWHNWRKCGNVLQLWQDQQNITAAFLRLNNHDIKDLLPAMEHHTFTGDACCVIPHAKLELNNIIFMAQYHLPY
ncbi:MAG TPA: hypothetical protein VHA52_03200, partial [Candidatus Babeliaceae bacterium]|nr:hypothetical protein [Candidatus Babeliaceae bacterium]